ncbi:hypothetical protein GCM10027413_29110 [Conyzicola nivalis]|uniref:HTH tetR-type domain-containing protein n=1 Tax=Conyzicola nivalis TaxID=1477021 RepID=A0A916SS39_9MICO|nr:TetR/AcrR family transcriptional regulator [Conyzicola nivalis]GGB13862.1 hypothetical protein GCM10010979_30400 [Conyzicola nivalis]
MNTRPYKMTSRAESAARTADSIADAMLQRFGDLPYERIRLEDIALDAGVTVQTVLRRFGSKPELLVSVVTRELGKIANARAAVARSLPAETITALADHYEKYGELILKTYAEAHLVDGLPAIAARGRAFHVNWCQETFAPHLDPATDEQSRDRRLAQIVAVCDARTWFILRIERALSVDQTKLALDEMISPLLAPATT